METRRVREIECTLPIGYEDEDGRLHRTAVLRKMTGRDESIIADKAHRNNASRMITELLTSCLMRIGSVERPSRNVVQALYSADRYFLLMKLRDGDVTIEEGEFYIVPRGVEHCPVAEQEVHIVLIEPRSTLNTGNLCNERTRAELERI